jgi:hypothetical protein
MWGGEQGGGGAHLPKLLINDSELEVIADDMLVEGDNEPGSLWRTHGHSLLVHPLLGQVHVIPKASLWGRLSTVLLCLGFRVLQQLASGQHVDE